MRHLSQSCYFFPDSSMCPRCTGVMPYDLGGRVALVVRNSSRGMRCSYADIIRWALLPSHAMALPRHKFAPHKMNNVL